MAIVQSWDGTDRRIYLLPGVNEFSPIDDLYREYRVERRTNEDFRKWDPFMAAYGNIPKGGGKATPRYLVLLDGVKVVPYDENNKVTTTGEMISSDPETDPDVFDLSDLTNPVKVVMAPADAEIVYVEIPSPISDNLDYGGTIHYDPTSPYSGTDHPTGTRAQPVNNLADASDLGTLYGITELRTQNGNITLDREFDGWKFKADSVNRYLDFNGQSVENVYVKGMHVIGNMNGSGFFETCGFGDITNFNGNSIFCALAGTIIFQEDSTCAFSHSISMIKGSTTHMFDFTNGNIDVALAGHAGGIGIKNSVHSTNRISLDMLAGKISVYDSNTHGTSSLRGVAALTNDTISGEFHDNIDTQGLINTSLDDDFLAYGGYVDIGDDFGTPLHDTTAFPAGTRAHPVTTFAEAAIIMETYHLHGIRLHKNETLNVDMTNVTFTTAGSNVYLDVNGMDVQGSQFHNIGIYGDFANAQVVIKECHLLPTYRIHGIVKDSAIDSTIQAGLGGELMMINCVASTTGSDYATLDMYHGQPTSVGLQNWSGKLHVINCDAPNDRGAFNINAGDLTLEDTCSNGLIEIDGVCEIVNESTGTELIMHELSQTSIADAVLDEAVADHNTPGTLGSFIRKILWRSK